jgi:Flp pilus assembly protein TadG
MGMMFRSFLRDRQGVSAVEFALMLPLLITMCFGLLEFHLRFSAVDAIARVSSQTADLVAMNTTQTTASLEDIRAATRTALAPLPTGNDRLTIDIASIGIERPGQPPRILWRQTSGTPMTLNPNIANNLGSEGESVIWVGISYRHSSPMALVMPQEQQITYWGLARPRLTRRIALNGQLEQ